MKNFLLLLFISISTLTVAQKKQQLKIINADLTYADKDYPDATISIGNVFVEINGATIHCKKVIMYSKDNYLKAMGDVVMNQGDTVSQTSDFVDYDGNKKLATSWGRVVLKDPTMTLTSEKVFFDREKQELYYLAHATIKDSVNVLKSKKGRYFLKSNKFKADTNVTVVNPDQTLETNHLIYFTDSGKAYLDDASTITGENSVVYTEKGFSDTKAKVSYLTKNSWIQYRDQLIEGDSLFYNEAKNYSTATRNIKMTDTVNNFVLKGGYAEFYKNLDSAFVTNRSEAISLVENDSLHIHGDTLLVTGKAKERVIKAFHHVKFYKIDLSGKCDSLVSIEATNLTKMFRRPILWSQGNQITGDIIHFLTNSETEALDSLKVMGSAFMIQKDSAGYNQTKGRLILGKFEDNSMKTIDVDGNSESIQFIRNEEDELIGISKSKSSKIHITMENKELNTIDLIGSPDGKTYPVDKIHKNDRKLKNFEWRASEQPLTKEDIFKKDLGDDELIRQVRAKEKADKIEDEKEAKRIKKRKLQQIAQRKSDSISNLEKEGLPLKPKKN
ncbi:MAG: hypothetical protein KAH07_08950 [Flavobacteriaceae bacterium]|nr:hypothetical protein [Flavobacteriaceae bacterium]